ncbi:BUD13 homolog [Copidosoma floridanum]|uniref:BUD13 homolog n=1 Tax=Copidosoma floridanum TaxID=29053 RepID=UPI0006C9C349|nr:BUD13 homolog [Copidosoma floridanum]
MEAPKINQKEYLKKYLSKGDSEKKKKKKKKIRVGPKTVTIIDDDIDLNKLSTAFDDDEISIFNATEDAPQIVGIVDERGPLNFGNKQKWKLIADDGTGDVSISKVENPQKSQQDNHKSTDSAKSTKEVSRKNKRNHSCSNSNSESDDDDRKSKKKKKVSLKRKGKHKKRDHSSSDSSDSSSDSESSTDGTLKKRQKKQSNGSDLNPPPSRGKNNKKEDNYLNPRKASELTKRRTSGWDEGSSNQGRKNKSQDESKKRHRSRSSSDSYSSSTSESEDHKSRKRSSDSDSKTNSSPDGSRKNEKSSRKRKSSNDSDLSPPRSSKDMKKRRHASDNDLSPPRPVKDVSRRRQADDDDLSPPRPSKDVNRRKKDSDNDFSARRSKWDKREEYDDSNAPRSKFSSHNSRSRDERSNEKRQNNDSDLSPPRTSRKPNKEDDLSPPRSNRSKDDSKQRKTLDGKSAGLQSLKALKEEEEAQKKREKEMLKKMSKEMQNNKEQVVIRDRRTGKRRNLEREAEEARKKQEAQNEINAKYSEWGKGLKQVEDRSQKLQRDLHEMSKPLARYADDEDLDKELRMKDREDDPMLAYFKEKEIKEGKRPPEKMKYQGSYMPNRFGIPPGCRWDGVDRSNGYEKKWFEAQNKKKAVEEEAYKWSSADL